MTGPDQCLVKVQNNRSYTAGDDLTRGHGSHAAPAPCRLPSLLGRQQRVDSSQGLRGREGLRLTNPEP